MRMKPVFIDKDDPNYKRGKEYVPKIQPEKSLFRPKGNQADKIEEILSNGEPITLPIGTVESGQEWRFPPDEVKVPSDFYHLIVPLRGEFEKLEFSDGKISFMESRYGTTQSRLLKLLDRNSDVQTLLEMADLINHFTYENGKIIGVGFDSSVTIAPKELVNLTKLFGESLIDVPKKFVNLSDIYAPLATIDFSDYPKLERCYTSVCSNSDPSSKACGNLEVARIMKILGTSSHDDIIVEDGRARLKSSTDPVN